MNNYHAVHGRLPPAVVYGADGTPLLSWRVLLLPYLEQEVFREFKLDEPWDSPHNRPLLAKMPPVFAPFDGRALPDPHSTFYQVFVGKGTAFEGPEGLSFKEDFPSGSSRTFLIVEAGKAVPWTKPEDIPYFEDKPVPKLGGPFQDTFRAAFADGHVEAFPQDLPKAALRAAIRRDGGGEPGR